MTCEDCIHNDACHYWEKDYERSIWRGNTNVENTCLHFNNKLEIEKALEKQIPKKPFAMAEHMKGCPACSNAVSRDYEKGFPYCMMCGQKLDWSD